MFCSLVSLCLCVCLRSLRNNNQPLSLHCSFDKINSGKMKVNIESGETRDHFSQRQSSVSQQDQYR